MASFSRVRVFQVYPDIVRRDDFGLDVDASYKVLEFLGYFDWLNPLIILQDLYLIILQSPYHFPQYDILLLLKNLNVRSCLLCIRIWRCHMTMYGVILWHTGVFCFLMKDCCGHVGAKKLIWNVISFLRVC